VNTFCTFRRSHRLTSWKSVILSAAAAASMLLGISAGPQARAANVVLTDGNSSVTIDPTSPAGVENWSVNGQNQLNQEWFWFRTGNKAGQSSLDSLGTPVTTLLDTTGDGQDDTAEFVYGPSNGIQITLTYSLTGGQNGSKTSDLTDTLEINNEGSKAIKLHLYQYANFNLADSTTGQTVTIANSNTATVQGNGEKSQTVVGGQASEYEAAIYPSLLDHISSSTTSYTLADVATSPSGDGEWGFQWDTTIPMCGSYIITGDQLLTGTSIPVVPEPVSGPVAVMGLSSLFMIRPRRRFIM